MRISIAIALNVFAIGTKKMIKANFKQFRRRSIAGDMPAQLAVSFVGAHHHRQGVPTDDRGKPLFYGQIAGVFALLLDRNGIAVGRIRQPATLGFPAGRYRRVGRMRTAEENRFRRSWLDLIVE